MTETEIKKKTKEAFEAWNDYATLSKILFARSLNDDSDTAKRINEILTDKSSKFYKDAVKIADECEMAWTDLSPEDSDELELMLLEDYYNRIRVDDTLNYVLNIKVQQKAATDGKEE